MQAGLIDGLRGNKQLLLDGYVYCRRKTSSVSVFWCCAQRGKFKCDGRVTTCNNELFTDPRNFHGHSHPPNEFHKEVTEARRNLREACQSPEARPLQVLSTALHDMSDGAKASMGKLASVQRDLRLHRQQVFPPVPQKVEDLEIPNEWKSTGGAEEKPFLFFDNGKVTDRILIFGTDECLNVLGRSDTWFMDGTFNVTTKLFQQLYVIRCQENGVFYSCVYAFMTRKTNELYRTLLIEVLKRMLDVGVMMANPKRVMLDFEIGAMNAVRTVFQHVEVKGCFFHLCKSTWRRIQSGGLAKDYKTRAEIKLYCGMVDALAFLPVQDVEEGMLLLWSTAPVELADILLYFDQTYVSGRPENDAPAMFPPAVWNVHDLVLSDGHKTDNVCESWNRRFKTLLGQTNPSFWAVVTALRKDESLERTKYLLPPQDAAAVENREKKEAKQTREFIKTKCLDYIQKKLTVEEFLKLVGQRIRF